MIEADSLEQVRGKPVYEYIAPEYRTDFVALTEKVLRGGSGTLEFELVGLKGTRRWLETHAVPLRDAGNGGSRLLALPARQNERLTQEEERWGGGKDYRSAGEKGTANIFLLVLD